MIRKNIIFRGFASNIYAQLVTLSIQVFSVPLMIKYWGVDNYALWLVITAIPSYLAIANLGVGNAAGSAITMLTGKGSQINSKECTLILDSALFVITCIVTICIFISTILYLLQEALSEYINFSDISFKAGIILFIYTFINFYGGVWEGILSAVNKYAEFTIIHSNKRLVEGGLILVSVYNKFNLFQVALVMLILSIVYHLLMVVYINKLCNMSFNPKNVDKTTLLNLVKPSLGFMAMPLGYAFFVQGSTLVAAILSPAFVVLFNTSRTLVSVGRQLSASISHTFKPQISMAIGLKSDTKVKYLIIKSLYYGIGLSSIYYLFVFMFGDYIYELWTKDQVKFDNELFIILAISSLLASAWHQGYIFLASGNNHSKFALSFLLVSITNMCSMLLLTKLKLTPVNIISTSIAADLTLLLIVFFYVRKVYYEEKSTCY